MALGTAGSVLNGGDERVLCPQAGAVVVRGTGERGALAVGGAGGGLAGSALGRRAQTPGWLELSLSQEGRPPRLGGGQQSGDRGRQ